jgi:hypothetical protein
MLIVIPKITFIGGEVFEARRRCSIGMGGMRARLIRRVTVEGLRMQRGRRGAGEVIHVLYRYGMA